MLKLLKFLVFNKCFFGVPLSILVGNLGLHQNAVCVPREQERGRSGGHCPAVIVGINAYFNHKLARFLVHLMMTRHFFDPTLDVATPVIV